jgi:hypothetical protein
MLDVHHVDSDTRDAMLGIWNRRRNEMLNCCSRETNKLECVREMQTARFDRVCSGEEPVCPWALLGRQRPADRADATNGMPGITERCCAMQGEERMQCFTNGMNNYRRGRYNRRFGTRRGGRGRNEQ